MFLVSSGVLLAITLSTLINMDSISQIQHRLPLSLQILYTELIGFMAPGPRYILYPILIKLQEFGVDIGVIIALVSSHVLFEPATLFVEAGFFGYRFPIKRFIVSLIVVFFAGMLSSLLGLLI